MRIFLTITLLLFSSQAFAEPVYLWIKKSDDTDFKKGDVLVITPATPQYEPTPSELINVYVVKADLTKEEQDSLLEKNIVEEQIDVEGEKIIKNTLMEERKERLDVDALKIKSTKEEFTKNEIITNTVDKSIDVIDTP